MARSGYYGKNDIRPDFLNTENSDDDGDALFRQQISANKLKDIEENATNLESSKEEKATALAAAGQAELLAGNSLNSDTKDKLYTGTGRKSKTAGGIKGRIRGLAKRGPAGAIAAILLATAFCILTASTNLGAQWEDRLTRATDPMNTSYAINTTRITREMLDGDRTMPEYMKKRFNRQEIEVDNAGHTLTYKGQVIDANNFDDVIKTDVEFREAYTKAKRGRVANFYDDAAEAVMVKLGLNRDVFHDYTTSDDEKVDRAKYEEIESEHFEGGTNTRVNTAEDAQKTDEDGNPVTDDDGNPVTERRKTGPDLDADEIEAPTATAKAKQFLFGTASKVSNAGNIGCALAKVGNMVAAAVAGNMMYQMIHYFMVNAETISKNKYGEGEHSSMNSFLNFLTTETTAKYTDIDTGEEKEVTGAPINAEGQNFALTDEKPNQAFTKNFTIEAAFAATSASLLLNGYNAKFCSGVQATSAIISLASLVVPGGGLIKASIGMLMRVAVTTGVQVLAATVLSALIPMIAKAMFTNPTEGQQGKPAGEFLMAGAGATNFRLGRSSSGQALADEEYIEPNARETAYINHLEAEVERHSRSPFDTTSQYTFFGHLLGQIAAIGNNNSVIKSVASTVSLTNRSIASLSTTYADGAIGTAYQTTYGDCPNLDSIGVKGDIYCNPIVISDLNTARINSNNPEYLAVINRNTYKDEDGKYHIIDNSDLAKYIIYCTERDSPFGIYDANIANAEEKSLGIVGDNLPYLNDVVDMVNAVEGLTSEGWAKGTYCGASKQNPYWEGNFEYLQHFIEDQRVCTQMGCEENVDLATGKAYNPVVAFKNDYYQAHPLDNSRAGTLARVSGLEKSDAETVLALMDYENYLASYDIPEEIPTATDSYISMVNHIEELKAGKDDNKEPNLFETIANISNQIIYADVRNRSYAA